MIDDGPDPQADGASSVFARHRHELEIGPTARPYRLRPVWLACIGGGVAGALVGSAELARWAFDLPLWLGPLRAGLVAATAAWHDAMQAVGLDGVHAAVRAGFQALAAL